VPFRSARSRQPPRITVEFWGALRVHHQEPGREGLVGGGGSLPRTRLRAPEFPANREKYREFSRFRAFDVDSMPNSARTFGHLDGSSLRTRTGNFRRPNRELIREIREFEPENREFRRAARWHPISRLQRWTEARCRPLEIGSHSPTTATKSFSAGFLPVNPHRQHSCQASAFRQSARYRRARSCPSSAFPASPAGRSAHYRLRGSERAPRGCGPILAVISNGRGTP
jgi:hypothetical protein